MCEKAVPFLSIKTVLTGTLVGNIYVASLEKVAKWKLPVAFVFMAIR
jgi:hypothetical protein